MVFVAVYGTNNSERRRFSKALEMAKT